MRGLLLLLLPAVTSAGGFEVAQQGAVAGGTAHAGAARDGVAEAAWHAPAALADDGGLRVALGAALAWSTVRADAEDGSWNGRTNTAPATPPHLYASYARGRWASGLAVNAAFASHVRWPDDWAGRFEALSSRPTFFRVAPFGAVRLGRVRLAVGPHVDVGGVVIRKATDHVVEQGMATLSLRGWGLGADASAWVELSDAVQLGLTWKSRTALNLSGEADFDVPAAFGSRFPDQRITSHWTLPDRLVLGAQVHTGAVTTVADASLTTWAVRDTTVFDFEDEATDDVVQVDAWRSTVALRVGGSVALGPRWTARGGAYVDGLFGAPPPASTLAPSSPDCTRMGATLGGGVRVGAARIDAFVEHLRLLGRTATGPDAPLASYRGAATVGGLTVSLVVPPSRAP